MASEEKNETFSYTYSAREQEELKRIREKYAPKEEKEEDKLTRIRRLDASVTKKGDLWSLIVGIIGALIMGFGMSIFMTELGDLFGDAAIVCGVIIGVIGMVIIALAYPLYSIIVKRERAKISDEINRLINEVIK